MEALEWLFQQFPSYQLIGSKAYKPTLENSRKILEFLNNPQEELEFVHIAGSNGKGSVSSYLASILKESGLKVGLFTSPHIADFSERIRVNGKPISHEAVTSFVDNIRKKDLPFSPSFFEITFGMALSHFKKEECDICIIETGLGGRLDATNVIRPELSIITSISYEHTDMLGDTLEAIAEEKAGIIKAQVPVIIGKGCAAVYSVFDNFADTVGSLVTRAPSHSSYDQFFRADYQRENFACVLASLNKLPYDVSYENIEAGIKNVTKNAGLYGRLQTVESNPTVIFDVAHNPDGIKSTLDVLSSEVSGELLLVYGSSKDKDIKKIVSILPERAHVFATEFTNSRSLLKEELIQAFHGTNFKSTAYFEDANTALDAAKALANPEDTIVVLGSFFLLSDFF